MKKIDKRGPIFEGAVIQYDETKRYVGIEIEVERRNKREPAVNHAWDFRDIVLGVNHDGADIEFQTHPLQLSKIYSNTQLQRWYNRLDLFAKENLLSGTHIHMTKLDANSSVVKWIEACFGPQIQKVAGRISSYAYPTPGENKTRATIRMGSNSKSDMFTINNSGETIEWRGPKSSTRIQDILAWIEFFENIMKVADKEEPITFAKLCEGRYITPYVESFKGDRAITPEEMEATTEVKTITVPKEDRETQLFENKITTNTGMTIL